MGAGILPVTIFKGSILFLLGKERYNSDYWSDFGGSSIPKETPFQTAIREGYEELDGFLGNKQELHYRVYDNLIKQHKYQRYTSFLFYVDYNELNQLEYYFNNHRKFIDEELYIERAEGIFEKSEVKLFSKKDLIKNINTIRPFYREITKELLELKINELPEVKEVS